VRRWGETDTLRLSPERRESLNKHNWEGVLCYAREMPFYCSLLALATVSVCARSCSDNPFEVAHDGAGNAVCSGPPGRNFDPYQSTSCDQRVVTCQVDDITGLMIHLVMSRQPDDGRKVVVGGKLGSKPQVESAVSPAQANLKCNVPQSIEPFSSLVRDPSSAAGRFFERKVLTVSSFLTTWTHGPAALCGTG